MNLDDLIALNDEIAALVRAGVPLEEGLAELGRDVPGRLGKLMTRLAEDSSRGRPLGEALTDPALGVPPVYRAVIKAGLRAGRLSAALESVVGSVGRLAQIHRCLVVALIYPVLLLIVAWGLFAGFTVLMAPRLLSAFEYFEVPGAAIFSGLTWLGQWAAIWGPAVPVLLLVLGSVWVSRSQRATLDARRTPSFLTWLPWLKHIVRWSRAAAFADLMATLVENRVPLHEAISLAADASGDPATIQTARPLADALERGEPVPSGATASTGVVLPPMFWWLIHAAQGQDALVMALKYAADTYRSRAQYQAELAQVLLPIGLTVVIGGTAVLVWAVAVLAPYAAILRGLS